jgi:hypothetical protein
VEFLGYPRDNLDICRLRCASDLLLFPEKFKVEQEIQQVKAFYADHPSKLLFTRSLVHHILKELGWDPMIFQFMYDL